MLDPKNINDMVKGIFDSLPEGVKNLPGDVQMHMRAGLQNALSKMDLVTREEFETQAAVLQKTRAKLDRLEEKIKQLENEE